MFERRLDLMYFSSEWKHLALVWGGICFMLDVAEAEYLV